MPVVGVFEQNQTAVRRKAAFSGEVERVSEVIEQVYGLVYPLETAPHGFAERAALVFVTYDLPDGFSGAGWFDNKFPYYSDQPTLDEDNFVVDNATFANAAAMVNEVEAAMRMNQGTLISAEAKVA